MRTGECSRFVPGHDATQISVRPHGTLWRPPPDPCNIVRPNQEGLMLKFGVSMFLTDYSMSPGELGQALEQRGFESVWAPEHSHIPVSRKTPFPGGGDLPKKYY